MITTVIEDHVATVTLDRPPANAFDDAQLTRLVEVTDDLRRRDDVRVALVQGAGRHFCAGADIAMLHEGMASPAGIDHLVGFAERLQQAYTAWALLPFPTIARVHGAATGGGLELALACDLRIAVESSRLGLPEAQLGLLAAAGGTQRLTRLIGRGRAARLMLRGELVDGTEAHHLGVVEWVVPDEDADVAVAEIVGSLVAVAGPAHGAIKQCIELADTGDQQGYEAEIRLQRSLHATTEAQQRVEAFLAERNRRKNT